MCGGAFRDGLAVESNVFVIEVSSRYALDVFVGDGGQDHNAGRGLPIVGTGLELGEKGVKACAKGRQAFLSREGFVVTEGRYDDIRLVVGEMLVEIAEVGRSGLQVDLVGWPGKVPDTEFMTGEALVEKRFEISVVPRIVEQAAPDKGDLVSRFQLQREGSCDWFGLRGPG